MKTYRLKGLTAAVVWLLIMIVADLRTCRYPLTVVSDAIQQEGQYYILDNQDDRYQIFSTDMAGVVQGCITLPKLEGEWWNTYSSLQLDTDGQIYVYSYQKTMDLGTSRSKVLRCDFSAGRLVPCWELPPDKMIQIQVTDGKIYYLASEPDRQAAFYRQDKSGNVECLLKPGVGYNQVKGFCWTQEEGVFWADWNGVFYRNKRILKATELAVRDYANMRIDQNGAFYTDLSTGKDMWIGSGMEAPEERNEADQKGRQNLPEELKKPIGQRIADGCRRTGIFLAVLLVGIAVRKGRTIPILVQLLAVLIPLIFLAGAALDDRIRDVMERRLRKLEYDMLYVIADQRMGLLNPEVLEQIDLWSVPEDAGYQELFQAADYSRMEKKLYEQGQTSGDPVIANTYCWVFLERQGDLRYLEVTDRHYYGTQVRYERPLSELEKMQEAMKQKHTVKSEYSDFAGSFLVLYVPIITEEGAAIGILECGLNKRILIYEVEKQTAQIRTILFWLSGGLVLLLVVVLTYYLYPLKQVRMAVEEVRNGTLGGEVPVRGRDEVAGISRAFNHMSRELKERVEYVRECSDRYASFVPGKVFEILEREDITRVELGDQREIDAAVLQVGSRQFSVMAKSLTGDRLYGMINRMLQEMIPIVSSHGGVIEHMAGDHLTAYYPKECEQALMTAISVCEKGNWMWQQPEPVPLYRMVLHYGAIRVGIIGQPERMAAATISEVMTFSSFLQETGEKYGIRILVTESAARQIPDFLVRFRVRQVGYIHLQYTKSLEAVYDVYDGEEARMGRAKEETKDLFTQALGNYLAQNFYEARLKFAQVLRRNPEDMVARAYIYRCDACYRSGDDQGMELWLEEY